MTDKELVNKSDVMYETRTFEWDNQTIEVKKFLPIGEAMGFVSNVVDGCFDDNGTFIPEALDFLKRYELVKRYTNIAMPNDTTDTYAILYGTELYNDIFGMVNLDQANALYVAIDKRIELLTNDKTREIENKINELYSTLSNFVNTIRSVFDDVTGEQLADFINAVANGEINEEKIASSVLKARREDASINAAQHK